MPTLDAINTAKKAELQSLARKLKYKVSGTKEELRERLRRGIYGQKEQQKTVSQFSKASQRTEFHERPKGELHLFGQESTHLVANLMGLGEDNNRNLLHDMTDLVSQQSSEGLVACYEDPSLQVNKSICRWCGHQTRCNEKENNYLRKRISYLFSLEAGSYNGIESDMEKLKSFIELNKYLVVYPQDDVNQPFSDEGDPFGPFFGRGYSRELHIVPAFAINSGYKQEKNVQWPHIYYSKYMNRTLTVLEAMIITLATSANSLKEAPDEFPMLREVSEYFLTLDITKQNLPTLGLKPTTEGGKLISNMISKTRRWYESGLYFGPVELFSFTHEKDPFFPALRKFLTDVKNALKRTIDSKIYESEKHNLFLQERNDVIILTPESLGSEFQLLPQYRPVREIVVKDLMQPWCIVDGEVHTKNHGLMLFAKGNYGSFDKRDYSKAGHILSEMVEHPMNFRFLLWNHVKEETMTNYRQGKQPLVVVYPPQEILAAYSSHAIFVNQKLTQNNRHFYKQRENFEIFIERMYFSKFDNRNIVKELKDERASILEVLNDARAKRLAPYERLIEMSKVAPNLIQYTDRDPDGIDDAKEQITEEFCLEFKYTKAGEEMFTKIVIRRVSKGEGAERKLSTARWEEIDVSGEIFAGQGRLFHRFMEAMNPGHHPGQKSNKVLGMYVSDTLWSHIMTDFDTQTKSEFSKHLGSILNSYSGSGVVCLSSPEEYEVLQSNLGPARLRVHKSTNQHNEEVQFVSWNPPEIAGNSSQLAFFIGTGS